MMAEVIARLETVAALKLVEGAAELAALTTNPPREKQPAAYAVPLTDSAGPNVLASAVRQRIASEFGVVLALGNFRGRHGGEAAADIEATVGAVRAAIVGWKPTPAHEIAELRAGELVDWRDGVVWWMDRYTTAELRSFA